MRSPKTPTRTAQAGLTLIEVMIASAILVVMMLLAWRTIKNSSTSKATFERFEERNHEIRQALARVVADFETAYLSRNEDTTSSNPRTLFRAKPGSRVPEIRFSTMGHRVLWSDANESEQTVIEYMAHDSRKTPGQTDWVRREQRRPSNLPPDDEPSEYDVLLSNIKSVKIEMWDWKNFEWQETWDTTQSDGEKGWLPSRVRISLTLESPGGDDYKLSTEARILLQEPLNFVQ